MSDKNVQRAYAILTGRNRPTYTMWPAFTGVPAAGIVMTPGAGAWGVYIDIIAAAAITTEFWVCEANFSLAAGAFGLHEVQIQNTTAVAVIYPCRVDVTAANTNMGPFKLPIPAHCAANSQIQGRTGATNAADKLSVSLLVATGM
jgi:hypothetical protein